MAAALPDRPKVHRLLVHTIYLMIIVLLQASVHYTGWGRGLIDETQRCQIALNFSEMQQHINIKCSGMWGGVGGVVDR